MKILASLGLAMLFLSAGAFAQQMHRAAPAFFHPAVNITIIEEAMALPQTCVDVRRPPGRFGCATR